MPTAWELINKEIFLKFFILEKNTNESIESNITLTVPVRKDSLCPTGTIARKVSMSSELNFSSGLSTRCQSRIPSRAPSRRESEYLTNLQNERKVEKSYSSDRHSLCSVITNFLSLLLFQYKIHFFDHGNDPSTSFFTPNSGDPWDALNVKCGCHSNSYTEPTNVSTCQISLI